MPEHRLRPARGHHAPRQCPSSAVSPGPQAALASFLAHACKLCSSGPVPGTFSDDGVSAALASGALPFGVPGWAPLQGVVSLLTHLQTQVACGAGCVLCARFHT